MNGRSSYEIVLKVIKESERPVKVSFVSELAGISWGTAKAALLVLAAKGEISMIETTGGLIFSKARDVR